MENRHDEISANDLLAKLKANLADHDASPSKEEHQETASGDSRKTYRFRRSGKTASVVTEEGIRREMPKEDEAIFVSPVPKSDIEDLDIDALMKKYLPEEDYAKMTARGVALDAEEEDELVRTLTSIELVSADESEEETGESRQAYAEEESEATYAAPDSELFAHLSAGGKVCDVPGDGEEDEKSDTRPAPLRPMTDAERTLAFGVDEEEGGFASVRELMAAEPFAETVVAKPVSAAETAEIAFVDEAPTTDLASLLEEAYDNHELSLPGNEAVMDEDVAESDANVEDDLSAWDAMEESDAESDADVEDDLSVWDTMEENDAEDLNLLEGISEASIETSSWQEADDELAFEAVPPDRDVFETVEFSGIDTAIFSLPTEFGQEAETATEEATDVDDADMTIVADTTEGDDFTEEDNVDDSDMIIVSDDEIDETDANLMLAFGMDEELDQALGKESADKLRNQMDELLPEEEIAKGRATVSETMREFISPAESKDIMEGYKLAYGKNMLCLFGVLVVALLLFFYENFTALGGTLADAVNPEFYPVVNIMVGLQILLIGFAFCFKKLVDGVRSLIDKKPTPDSFLFILLLVSILYSVAVCFFPAGTLFVTFHFPTALCLLFTMLGEHLDLRREIMTFNIVSSKRAKFALEKLDIRDAELEARAFDEFLPTSPSIFKINKTSFVDGYFHRTKAYPSLKLVLNAFLPATLVALVVGFVVGAFQFRAWQDAVMLAYTVFSFCMPATIFLAFCLPSCKAEKLAYDMKSAFVGESAVDEYTTAASISFDDREVFPTGGVKLRSLNVFGSGQIDTVIYQVASVYAILGGPLSDVLNVITADFGHSDDAEILAIENEGVEAIVDEHHLFIGKADYLRARGYVPVSDPDDEEIEGGGDLNIMYLVCDDEVVAKFYVRYRIDPEFEITLKNLYRSGICVGIKTVDPNINDAMLSTRIRLSKYPVRVLKYNDITDSYRGADRTDSGLVSKKSAKALLRTFTLCDKMKHVTRSNLVVTAIAMVTGLILSLAVAMLGSLVGISSVYVALFYFFWLIPVYLLSRFMLM